MKIIIETTITQLKTAVSRNEVYSIAGQCSNLYPLKTQKNKDVFGGGGGAIKWDD